MKTFSTQPRTTPFGCFGLAMAVALVLVLFAISALQNEVIRTSLLTLGSIVLFSMIFMSVFSTVKKQQRRAETDRHQQAQAHASDASPNKTHPHEPPWQSFSLGDDDYNAQRMYPEHLYLKISKEKETLSSELVFMKRREAELIRENEMWQKMAQKRAQTPESTKSPDPPKPPADIYLTINVYAPENAPAASTKDGANHDAQLHFPLHSQDITIHA